MADNVKWILDHNPKAKIVLWAHNGHVATEGFSYETMGSVLSRCSPPGRFDVSTNDRFLIARLDAHIPSICAQFQCSVGGVS